MMFAKIHIAFADYDPKRVYSRHVGVAMASIMDNATLPVCFHILHNETLTDDNRAKLTATVKMAESKHGLVLEHEICFEDVTRFYQNFEEYVQAVCKGFSEGTTYYLTLPEALPDINRVIFTDSDTVTMLDMAELWNMDLKGLPVAAVKDTASHPIYGIENADESQHINTGIMIFDLAALRADIAEHGSLLTRCVEYIRKYKPHFIEQEFMSAAFYGKILFLDMRFNTMNKAEQEDLSAEKIWHFANRKPWIELVGSNTETLYWRYMQKTAWKDEVFDAFYFAATNGGHLHRHTSDCLRRMRANVIRETKRAVAKLLGSKKFIEG